MRRLIWLAAFALLLGAGPARLLATVPPETPKPAPDPCLDVSPEVAATTRGTARELRLGLVFYGGVSLAIYMHGQVKELHHLVIASRAHESPPDSDAPCAELEGTARVYCDALGEVAGDGARIRVLIDSIAGTSAGGINGIFLAKALAHDQSQDALRDLWLDKADIWKLLGGPVEAPFRLTKLAIGLPFGKARAPLDGSAMLRWVYDALEGMERDCPGASLVPPGERLRLFVPTTDFRGRPRGFVIGEPPHGVEKEHRKRLELEFERSDSDVPEDPFGPANNLLLAFAARSTSSFPGAFPPISLQSIEKTLCQDQRRDDERCEEGILDSIRSSYFAEYALDGAEAADAWFVDGGVLDNYPFGHVIEDLTQRAPARQVDRRLVYLQPDPADPPGAEPSEPPGYLNTIWGGLSTIARAEPIGDDFRNVQEFNERVRLGRDVLEHVRRRFFPDEKLDQLLGLEGGRLPTKTEAEGARAKVHEYLKQQGGLSYAAYLELRTLAVAEQLGRVTSRECRHGESVEGAVLRAAIHEWAEQRRLVGSDPDPRAQEQLRESLDAGYLWRQLRFVSDRINAMYDDLGPGEALTRAHLDDAQAKLSARIEEARQVMRGTDPKLRRSIGPAVLELCSKVEAFPFDEPLEQTASRFVAEHGDAMDALYEAATRMVRELQEGIREGLLRDYQDLTAESAWSDRRTELYRHYLGFPFWDLVVYPYQRLSDAGEFQEIQLVRMSPNDANALGEATADEKLGGTRVAHFGAFFKRHRREQDYLWGRLDGSERILALLYGLRSPVADSAEPVAEPPEHVLKQAFGTIAAEERPGLRKAGGCIDEIERLMGSEAALPRGHSGIPDACKAR